MVEGTHRGATAHPDLQRYSTGQARRLMDELLDGTTATGQPVLEPEVAEIDLQAEPPSIVVEDCLDGSRWEIAEDDVDAQGELKEGEGPRPVTATVTKGSAAWKVADWWIGEYGACEQ
ncbi:hypothetical protein [Streptomonospora litoralis]|uniref:hypothetical protein n=1 Tax=Streptomonospora litoralis TaxID=2498135 RepID=UPI00103595BB|nr:hypothetical protein [Streptomonospora litoralis]